MHVAWGSDTHHLGHDFLVPILRGRAPEEAKHQNQTKRREREATRHRIFLPLGDETITFVQDDRVRREYGALE